MFSLRKRTKTPHKPSAPRIRGTVAGASGQIDHLVAIARDAGAPTSDRVTALEIVRSFVEFQSLSSISEIWYAVRDTTSMENTAEVRRAGWKLTLSCIDHDEVNNSAFTAYYASIVRNSNVEDFDLVLTCLEHLTNDGRKVVGSQAPRQLPRVLLGWIQILAVRSQELRSNQTAQDVSAQWGASTEEAFNRVLVYATNVLKFNMSIWDPIEIEKLLLVAVTISRKTSQVTDCRLCCGLIESVIAFGLMPATVLQPVLEILCGIISMVPSLVDKCVSIIQKLSRSHLQNSTVVRLCRILDEPNSEITQSMRIAAAHQLKDLLVQSRSAESEEPLAPPAASSSMTKPSSMSTSNSTPASAFVPGVGPKVPRASHAAASPSNGGVLDDSSVVPREDVNSGDASLPVLDVLESYYKTLIDPLSSLKLILAILDCFHELVTKFDLLKRTHTTSWLGTTTSDEVDTEETLSAAARLAGLDDEEDVKVSPTNIVKQFSELFVKFNTSTESDKQQVQNFREKMRLLGAALTDILLEKSLSTSISMQILTCIQISHFLDTEACEKLLNAIESVQLCTPGINNWFQNLCEVLDKIYMKRTDRCRAHVVRIVREIYALDAQNEGWIDLDNLEWITRQSFSIIGSADEQTMDVLMRMFDEYVFFSEPRVFASATRQLVTAAINEQSDKSQLENRLKSVQALTVAFGRAYRLYARQALVILNGLTEICQRTLEVGEVFAKAWAILCRLRADRWDRLLIVNHRVEESYFEELRNMQEPLPLELEEIHAVPSFVLKIKTTQKSSPDTTFDTLPILEILVQALKRNKTDERTLVLLLINGASQLAHYRILCESDMHSKLPRLQELRNCLDDIVASGGSRIADRAGIRSAAKRNGCVNVVLHMLSVLLPFRPLFPKAEHDKLIHTLVTALGKWNLSTGWVVHCFTLACYEAPYSVQRYLPQILSRFQLKITGRDSSMYILDFLLSLSLEGSLTKNFTEQDFKRVFGMCFLFIQNANDLLALRYKSDITAQWLLRLAYSAISNLFLSMRLENRRILVPYLVRNLVLATRDPEWVDPMSLVVYDMINRFAYSDVPLRTHMDTVPKLEPGWDVKRWMRGVAVIEIRCNRRTGQAVRIIRRPAGIFTTYMTPSANSDFGAGFDPLDPEHEDSGTGNYTANFYMLCGQLGLGTFQFANKTDNDRGSANTAANYNSHTFNNNGNNSIGSSSNNHSVGGSSNNHSSNHGQLLQPLHSNSTMSNVNQLMTTKSNDSSSPSVAGPDSDHPANSTRNSDHAEDSTKELPPQGTVIPLAVADDPATNRAINSLDRVPIVDLCKVGIIYCAPGQTKEAEILANSSGSASYRRFLEGIGQLIRLKHNRMYYVGGLDTEQDLDGQYALAWSSKILQIIFHTITMMPNYDGDKQFASKKRHIGNNFVNIYFDESGEDFEFDIVKSQFNFINIVITPTYTDPEQNHRYWKVRAYRKPGMLNTSAAYDVKVVSEDNLALFVRNLALKFSQYAAIHHLGSEYMDNWVYRLQMITTLRERIEQANATAKRKTDQASANNVASAGTSTTTATANNGSTTNTNASSNAGSSPNNAAGGAEDTLDELDDDYLISDETNIETTPTSTEKDLKALNWMDFTRFTI